MGPAMGLKEPRKREFAELMPHHLFRDIDRQEFPAIMDGKSVAHKFRGNRAGTSPSLDDFFIARGVKLLHFFQKPLVNKRALLG